MFFLICVIRLWPSALEWEHNGKNTNFFLIWHKVVISTKITQNLCNKDSSENLLKLVIAQENLDMPWSLTAHLYIKKKTLIDIMSNLDTLLTIYLKLLWRWNFFDIFYSKNKFWSTTLEQRLDFLSFPTGYITKSLSSEEVIT